MNKDTNYAGIVALILSISLALVLLISVIANIFFDQELTEGAAEILKTIAVGLVGALAVWLGHEIKKNGVPPHE